MNKFKNKEEVLKMYEEAGKLMYQATLDGDYKTNNREGKKLIKIFKYFEENRPFAMECINEMFQSKNVVIQTEAAAYCLALNENTDLAEKVLLEISENEENGIFGFNAKMTLQVWREQGYLRLYQEKK